MYNQKIKKILPLVEQDIQEELNKVDQLCLKNSEKVLNAFKQHKVSESHLNGTTGYGYNDIGRETIENIFSSILGAEDSLVRCQFISGTHALTVALFSMLRPGDLMLSITGKPYDTLDEVIGLTENNSSLKAYNIKYDQIDLLNNDFDDDQIVKYLSNHKVKLIEIQRSKGYSTRKSISIEQIERITQKIKNTSPETIIMVDNCYCEFVCEKSPLEVGTDIIVGSLIKNLGGGIAPNGAYISGKKELVHLAAERLNVPGEAKEVGPSLGMNRLLLQGLFMAPNAVASSLKTAIFTSKMLEKLGYIVEPKYNEKRSDIVQSIIFKDHHKLIKYCEGIQSMSPIDSFIKPIPDDMPGYLDKVIMASGSFTQGSSIELSCDGPLREPYIAYQQGSLTYEYGKIAVLNAINSIIEENTYN